MARAARSFTEPPGFMNSALPRISQPVCVAEAVQADQRRVADRIGESAADASCDAHAVSLHRCCRDQRLRSARGACVEPVQRFVQARHFAHDQQRRRLNRLPPRLAAPGPRACRSRRAASARVPCSMTAAARVCRHAVLAQARDDVARADRGPCRTRRSGRAARAMSQSTLVGLAFAVAGDERQRPARDRDASAECPHTRHNPRQR